MADSYQAVTNWACFAAIAGAAVWYYLPKENKPQKPAAVKELQKDVKEIKKEVKKEVKKAARKEVQPSRTAPPANESNSKITENQAQRNGNEKRKANGQTSAQTPAAPSVEQPEREQIDMSTRQFAEQMRRAQQGVDVKQTSKNDSRVKTVKPKSSQIASPILSSGSSQAGEEDWAPAVSPALKSTGIDDMLEPTPAAPNSLRITTAQNPIKERINKPKKEEVVETKKQRQNRRKREEKQRLQQEASQSQKELAEQQRRAARIARGEPARNGVSIPAAPVSSPWQESKAGRGRGEQPSAVVSNGDNGQLLDTFDVESNSSSNAENSTAATSITDHAPQHDKANAAAPASLDAGWTTQVSKKGKKKVAIGDAIPPTGDSGVQVKPTGGKPSGFQALQDEYEERADTDSAWTA